MEGSTNRIYSFSSSNYLFFNFLHNQRRTVLKITEPIDERLWQALNRVANYVQFDLENSTDADYKYADGLAEAVELVSEYASCFGADGSVSQRGQVPSAWNQDTIFEDWKDKPSFKTEDASAEQKDANAKKLLEELT